MAAAAFFDADSQPVKELLYTGPDLTGMELFADIAKTDMRYTKVFNYGVDGLELIELQRVSDSAMFEKTLIYSVGVLVEVQVAAV